MNNIYAIPIGQSNLVPLDGREEILKRECALAANLNFARVSIGKKKLYVALFFKHINLNQKFIVIIKLLFQKVTHNVL